MSRLARRSVSFSVVLLGIEWIAARVCAQTALGSEGAPREHRTPELIRDLGLPDFLHAELAGITLWQWIGILLIALLAYAVGVALAAVLLRVSEALAEQTDTTWDERFVKLMRRPARLLLTVVATSGGLQLLGLAPVAAAVIHRALLILMISGLAWLAHRFLGFVIAGIQERAVAHAEAAEDDAKVRVIRTQLLVMRRVLSIAITTIGAALVLMQFELVRSVGMSLLASAGVASVVIGLAAQKSIAGILAGIQLSITQPIRIGDTVIIEGEYGTVEEINLTYVVVRVWDQRRLIIPIGHFLEKPFENWTKANPELLGTIFFYADYQLPVEAARAAFDDIVTGHELWDQRAKGLLVTDVTERTLQLRAMVSARNASEVWELRCYVREAIMTWLRTYEGGRYLPALRVDTER